MFSVGSRQAKPTPSSPTTPTALLWQAGTSGEIIYWLDIGTLKDLRFQLSGLRTRLRERAMLGSSPRRANDISDDPPRSPSGDSTKVPTVASFQGGSRGYLNDPRHKSIVVDRELAQSSTRSFERYAAGTETVESLATLFSKIEASYHGRRNMAPRTCD